MPTCCSQKMGLEFWKWRPYKVRSLVSNPIYAKKDRNGPPDANQVLLKTSPDVAMLFAPFGCTHQPPPVPPFLLTQNLSPKHIAESLDRYIRYRP